MARVPLIDPDTQDPVVAALFAAIRAKGDGPLNLHRTIANAPELLGPFLDLAFALRAAPVSPRIDRELVILRTLQLAGGDYGFAHHRAMGLSFGLTEAQIGDLDRWRNSPHFSDRQRALLSYADAMTSPDGVDDATYQAVATILPPREMVEITLSAAFYAMVAHFTRALRVPLDSDDGAERYGQQ